MPLLFDPAETAFSRTAMSLQTISKKSMSFTAWGNPDRSKINDALFALAGALGFRRAF